MAEIDEQDYPNNPKKRICIDFDGVIHQYSKKYHDGTIYDGPMPGAKEFLMKMKQRGYGVVVYTARPYDTITYEIGIQRIKEWLDKWNIPYDDVTGCKIPAIAYIDDRAVRFDGNWDFVEKEVVKLSDTFKK
jgi:hypothetical protein